MRQWLDAVAGEIGVGALYAAAFCEGAGLPVPYEIIFLAFGVLVEAGEVSLGSGVFGLLAASSLGNAVGYTGGRLFGRRLLPWLLRRSPALRRLWRERRDTLQDHIFRALITLRWIGFGFGPAVWLAGLQRAPLGPFVLTTALVNAVWVGVWSILARQIVDRIANLQQPGVALVVLIGLAAGLLYLRGRLLRERGGKRGGRGDGA